MPIFFSVVSTSQTKRSAHLGWPSTSNPFTVYQSPPSPAGTSPTHSAPQSPDRIASDNPHRPWLGPAGQIILRLIRVLPVSSRSVLIAGQYTTRWFLHMDDISLLVFFHTYACISVDTPNLQPVSHIVCKLVSEKLARYYGDYWQDNHLHHSN